MTGMFDKLPRSKEPAADCCRVLLADDSEDDRWLLKAAMRGTRKLRVAGEVSDGAETIAYLHGQGAFADRERHPLPDLLLLDLKMPVMDGFQVLEWLQTNVIAQLVVVVLTDSMRAEHIKSALDLGADLFQVKPRSRRDYEAMMRALEELWLNRRPVFASLESAFSSVEAR